MEFRLLGPFEVVVEGQAIPLDAAKPRALLALLLLRANEPVSRDLLIEQLWAGQPPSSARKVLQTYVSQLRGALGRSVIRTVSSAYELRAHPESVDLHRFEQLMRDARAAAPPEANGILREALGLWRGPALVEFAYESWAQPEIDRLEELRLDALQERIETDLALGASSELVAEIEVLVGQYPLRERLRAQLMLALYRAGRQADALAAYRDARRALVDAPGSSRRRRFGSSSAGFSTRIRRSSSPSPSGCPVAWSNGSRACGIARPPSSDARVSCVRSGRFSVAGMCRS